VNTDPIDLLRGELAALRRQNRNLTFLACAALTAAAAFPGSVSFACQNG
jgi:hypothetical protein